MNAQRRTTTMENKTKEFDNKPIVETQISKSKDEKYLLHVTKITDIKPIGYYAKVMESTGQ